MRTKGKYEMIGLTRKTLVYVSEHDKLAMVFHELADHSVVSYNLEEQ